MTGHAFTSVFGPQIEQYLAFKEKLGFHGLSRIWYLTKFDAYCDAHDRQVFDRATVEGWVIAQSAHSGRYRSWTRRRRGRRSAPPCCCRGRKSE